jgi:hypothetical protein
MPKQEVNMSTFPPLRGIDTDGGSGKPNIGSYGVWGDSHNGEGVLGNSANGDGVFGISDKGQGVVGVSGSSNGVSGTGASSGVSGSSDKGIGVYGESSNDGYNFGVVGKAPNAGVATFNSVKGNTNAAYLASGCCAAWFTGDVVVIGSVNKSATQFQIDHPLDPANKYLFHSAIESSEMKNIYDGIVVLNANGEGIVELPTWFEPLNADFRYQLTPIGTPGPNLHIAEEISNNRFKIGARGS